MSSDGLPGRVLLLNGASSAGKSTLAHQIQRKLTEVGSCWVIFSWDDFIPRLPWRWLGVPGALGDLADEGCRYRVLEDGKDAGALLEVGEVGARMLGGYHRAIAAIARAGVNVVVEEVMITVAEWHDWTQALSGLDVRWVGVRCDVDAATARERQRGDRYPGLARGTSCAAHLHAVYDVEVDTSSVAAEDAAVTILERLGPWLTRSLA